MLGSSRQRCPSTLASSSAGSPSQVLPTCCIFLFISYRGVGCVLKQPSSVIGPPW
jgi:hypothetical protein